MTTVLDLMTTDPTTRDPDPNMPQKHCICGIRNIFFNLCSGMLASLETMLKTYAQSDPEVYIDIHIYYTNTNIQGTMQCWG